MRADNKWRYTIAGVSLAIIGVMIILQMVRIQVGDMADIFGAKREDYEGVYRTVYPPRGQIFDRWGNLLAGNRTVYQIGLELKHIEDPEGIAFAMTVVLEKDYEEMLSIARTPESPTAVYAVLADFVSAEEIHQITELAKTVSISGGEQAIKSLQGLVFVPHLQRSYPEIDLAGNILGFVSLNGQGYFGVEEKYNQLLSGEPETIWMPEIPSQVDNMPEIPPGASLILTIDREVQATIESVLEAAVLRNGAEAGTIVVIEPSTGEILAMASTPRIDLNSYWEFEDVITGTSPFNRAVSKSYEPGSVFKVLTMAAAMDSGTVDLETKFMDEGLIEIGGAEIKNWDQGAWGEQDMLGCMQHSLNVCLAWLATQMGPKIFYDYMLAFGLGHTTGIDLAGEVAGRLKMPGDPDWFEADLGTNSFGQGVSATPIQMAAAIAALANDGKMMAPHILRGMVNNGHQFNPQPQVVAEPISPESARAITRMLADSLENEASTALVPGYRMAGKTGTAEIPTPYGYTSQVTHTSFVGWGPIEDPRFLVYIWLEKPSSSIWGSEVAAPIFRLVVEKLVVQMDIPPDSIRAAVAP